MAELLQHIFLLSVRVLLVQLSCNVANLLRWWSLISGPISGDGPCVSSGGTWVACPQAAVVGSGSELSLIYFNIFLDTWVSGSPHSSPTGCFCLLSVCPNGASLGVLKLYGLYSQNQASWWICDLSTSNNRKIFVCPHGAKWLQSSVCEIWCSSAL